NRGIDRGRQSLVERAACAADCALGEEAVDRFERRCVRGRIKVAGRRGAAGVIDRMRDVEAVSGAGIELYDERIFGVLDAGSCKRFEPLRGRSAVLRTLQREYRDALGPG